MLNKVSQYYSQSISAIDGDFGECADFILDDSTWVIRYIVVDTSSWLSERKVLISPTAVIQSELENNLLSLRLSKSEIENSPLLDSDAPVSREYERQYYKYYGYNMYWLGPNLWGTYPDPYGSLSPVDKPDINLSDDQGIETKNHLRSCKEISTYDAFASDGQIGKIEDFIFDDKQWNLANMILNTGNWLFGKSKVVPINNDLNISWADKSVTFNDKSVEIVKSFKDVDDINLHE
tara:strand:+ start:301 stop:1005 length:705 start_codon:yes stop_codon:yes gene_type:complete